jgi:N-methylhydantoinase A
MGVPGRADHEQTFRELEARAAADLPDARTERFADMRYSGQSYELTLPWGADFHAAHTKEYGYSDPERLIEIVTLRVRAVHAVQKLKLRGSRESKEPVRGPALITDYGSTTYVPEGWSYASDTSGNLILSRKIPPDAPF